MEKFGFLLFFLGGCIYMSKWSLCSVTMSVASVTSFAARWKTISQEIVEFEWSSHRDGHNLSCLWYEAGDLRGFGFCTQYETWNEKEIAPTMKAWQRRGKKRIVHFTRKHSQSLTCQSQLDNLHHKDRKKGQSVRKNRASSERREKLKIQMKPSGPGFERDGSDD